MTQAQALAIMKTGVNIYLTGSAGSGKTYLLNQYISYLREHDIPVAITASTGIAATHMNGMTIHGWSGIGIREELTKYDLDALEDKPYLWKRFQSARVLIIDEVSMLHAHRLDMVDQVCRKFKREPDLAFGGLQVILSGDLFQLPPINKSNDPDVKDLIIYSRAWQSMKPAICYLTEQHRQEDQEFTDILNAIRDDNIGELHQEQLLARMNAPIKEGIKLTKLYTHNRNVDLDNTTELSKINEAEKSFTMESTGNPVLVEILKKSCLAHEKLILKIGAEVMFIKNNFEAGYVNGTRGIVESFSADGSPSVRLYNGKSIYVTAAEWAIEEDGKKKASITQLPLRLAWAITIHKSQGMSLDHAEIDLSQTFSYGMGYVALSRVRTLAGIKLTGLNQNALQIDPKVLEYDKELRGESTKNEKLFGKLKAGEQKKLEEDFIIRMGGTIVKSKNMNHTTQKVEKISTLDITEQLLSQGKSLKQICKERNLTPGTITHHIEQILELKPETIITHIRPPQKHIDLVKKACTKITKEEDAGKLSPIKSILDKEGHKLTFEDIRLAKLFI
jgi:ATP-dependent exoDNAse (exonuclease V) alpha subunit